MELKFYYCEDCDNVVIMLKDSGVPMMCCGQPMIELIPGKMNASLEKHMPVYQVEGNQVVVTIGTTEHTMEENHFVEWVALQTKQTAQRKTLHPGQQPKVSFAICEGDEAEAVYVYCSQHGFWKAE